MEKKTSVLAGCRLQNAATVVLQCSRHLPSLFFHVHQRGFHKSKQLLCTDTRDVSVNSFVAFTFLSGTNIFRSALLDCHPKKVRTHVSLFSNPIHPQVHSPSPFIQLFFLVPSTLPCNPCLLTTTPPYWQLSIQKQLQNKSSPHLSLLCFPVFFFFTPRSLSSSPLRSY